MSGCDSTTVMQGETIRCGKEAGHDGLHVGVIVGMAFGNPDWVMPFDVQWDEPAWPQSQGYDATGYPP